MSQYSDLIRSLTGSKAVDQLRTLYGNRDGQIVTQTDRYTELLSRHEKYFPTTEKVRLISAPGRMEIGGNHTDHNRGKVLAASASLDTVAAVAPRPDMIVRVRSEGYPPLTLDLNELDSVKKEEGTTTGLIRGVAARMKEMGHRIGGFDATITSTVVSGSGLSSSAAFEVLMVAIFDRLYNDGNMDFMESAKISQYSENVYFGKPSGLLDQAASAAGGLVTMDFKLDEPKVKRLSYDFASKGYALVVQSTGGSHADLTDAYSAVPREMKEVAAFFHEDVLRRVRSEEFYQAIPQLRGKVSDRAILRAMHFYQENERVTRQVEALEKDDIQAFFREIIASGRSSFMYLQNVYARENEQSLSIALAMAESMLEGRGAWRVHGGGFAGTTLNFVPLDMVEEFRSVMEPVFGAHSCHVLDIRPVGAAELVLND